MPLREVHSHHDHRHLPHIMQSRMTTLESSRPASTASTGSRRRPRADALLQRAGTPQGDGHQQFQVGPWSQLSRPRKLVPLDTPRSPPSGADMGRETDFTHGNELQDKEYKNAVFRKKQGRQAPAE